MDQASGALKTLYAEPVEKNGNSAAVYEAQSLIPDVLRQQMALYLATLREQSRLFRAEREIIAVVVSATNQCDYCMEHHACYAELLLE
jgi:alkylhydroperoxidase family enzyme